MYGYLRRDGRRGLGWGQAVGYYFGGRLSLVQGQVGEAPLRRIRSAEAGGYVFFDPSPEGLRGAEEGIAGHGCVRQVQAAEYGLSDLLLVHHPAEDHVF